MQSYQLGFDVRSLNFRLWVNTAGRQHRISLSDVALNPFWRWLGLELAIFSKSKGLRNSKKKCVINCCGNPCLTLSFSLLNFPPKKKKKKKKRSHLIHGWGDHYWEQSGLRDPYFEHSNEKGIYNHGGCVWKISPRFPLVFVVDDTQWWSSLMQSSFFKTGLDRKQVNV